MSDPETKSGRRRAFAILPLVFLVLTVVVVAVAEYFLLREPLTRSQAANAVNTILDSHEPITLSFHTGLVRDRLNESARDSEYRLLEKAGIVVAQSYDSAAQDSLTANGKDVLDQIPVARKSGETDGTEAHVVPLAVIRLDEIYSIETLGH